MKLNKSSLNSFSVSPNLLHNYDDRIIIAQQLLITTVNPRYIVL